MLNQKLNKEIKRIILAYGYSVDGLKAAWGQAAFRTEIIISIILFPFVLIIPHNPAEKALLIGSVILVLIMELINTAIEITINRISLEIHPLSKQAKDIGSAIVMLAIINAVIIWLVILWN